MVLLATENSSRALPLEKKKKIHLVSPVLGQASIYYISEVDYWSPVHVAAIEAVYIKAALYPTEKTLRLKYKGLN